MNEMSALLAWLPGYAAKMTPKQLRAKAGELERSGAALRARTGFQPFAQDEYKVWLLRCAKGEMLERRARGLESLAAILEREAQDEALGRAVASLAEQR